MKEITKHKNTICLLIIYGLLVAIAMVRPGVRPLEQSKDLYGLKHFHIKDQPKENHYTENQFWGIPEVK